MTNGDKRAGVKTLDNGLRVLKTVAGVPTGLTLTELSYETQLHATVVSRLLHTLEHHNLVRRDDRKRYSSGAGLINLANSVDLDLRSAADPILQRLTEEVQAASFMMVTAGQQSVVAELVIQPRHSAGYVSFSAGSMHALDRGSGGIAILVGRATSAGEPPEVRAARSEGVAVSAGQIIPNVIGVAAPLRLTERFPEASIGVSLLSGENLEVAKRRVKVASSDISERLIGNF